MWDCVCDCVCAWLCVCVCVWLRVWLCLCVIVWVWLCVYVFISVCMCVCICEQSIPPITWYAVEYFNLSHNTLQNIPPIPWYTAKYSTQPMIHWRAFHPSHNTLQSIPPITQYTAEHSTYVTAEHSSHPMTLQSISLPGSQRSRLWPGLAFRQPQGGLQDSRKRACCRVVIKGPMMRVKGPGLRGKGLGTSASGGVLHIFLHWGPECSCCTSDLGEYDCLFFLIPLLLF